MDMIEHTLSQVGRFSTMLAEGDTTRPRDQVIAQLFYNLGQYAQLVGADGRALWRFFEECMAGGNYTKMAAWAVEKLAAM